MERRDLEGALAHWLPRSRSAWSPLSRALDSLDAGIDPGRSAFRLFEVGLNSGSPRTFQVNQVQGYRDAGTSVERELTERKVRGVLGAARALAPERARFSFDRAEAVARIFADAGSAFRRVLFSFEFDAAAQRATKFTLYGFLGAPEHARRLCDACELPPNAALHKRILERQWNVGVDFPVKGGSVLKLYRLMPLAEAPPAAARLARRMSPLSVRDYAAMLRLSPQGRPERSRKWGFNFSRPTTVAELARCEALLERHSAFLEASARACPSLDVSYLAFEGEHLGLYAGCRLDTWLACRSRAPA